METALKKSGHNEKQTFRCEMCGKSFINRQKLAKHIGAVHNRKKPFKCDICDYGCSQKSEMIMHITSVHEGKKPFKCDICDYRCSQKSNLICMLHMCMKEERLSNVTFVTTVVVKRGI